MLGRELATHWADFGNVESNPNRTMPCSGRRLLATRLLTRPVLMIFEDLQWVDPTSRELLDLIIERMGRWAMLLTATFRPEFQPPWADRPQLTLLSLNRLSRHHAGVMVQQLKGAAATLPNDVVDEIVERCDGVALFLEELTKAVLEQSAAPDRARAMVSTIPAAAPTVPATLQASLMARLDRLGSVAKEVAQIGAAIGREFSFELLTKTTPRNQSELRSAITGLVEAGLVFQRGIPPRETFLFKRALVQDAAYGTLLRGPRQLLHGRIAHALVTTSDEKSGAAPEIIARHLQNAGRSTEAIGYWREAGEQAVRRAANREGIEHFRRALNLLNARPETAERWREAWIRRRLRSYLWRQWRNGRNRFKELRCRGVPKFNAAVAAGSPTGFWRMSGHPAVQQALRNHYFNSLGLPQLFVSAQA